AARQEEVLTAGCEVRREPAADVAGADDGNRAFRNGHLGSPFVTCSGSAPAGNSRRAVRGPPRPKLECSSNCRQVDLNSQDLILPGIGPSTTVEPGSVPRRQIRAT